MSYYRDLLARFASDPGAPAALDRFGAWEIAKELWRIRRVGIDADAIQAQVFDRHSHREKRLNSWVETAERARERNAAVKTVTVLKGLVQELKAQIHADADAPALRVIRGGD